MLILLSLVWSGVQKHIFMKLLLDAAERHYSDVHRWTKRSESWATESKQIAGPTDDAPEAMITLT